MLVAEAIVSEVGGGGENPKKNIKFFFLFFLCVYFEITTNAKTNAKGGDSRRPP
jgi:hypothetical protein